MGQELSTLLKWDNLIEALNAYEVLGYKRVEVPWMVDREPKKFKYFNPPCGASFQGKCVIRTAEQSFMELAANGELEHGTYVSLTPCFRDDTEDETHKLAFMKVELFSLLEPLNDATHVLFSFVNDSLSVMKKLSGIEEIELVKTDIGYDLEIEGIEVGSFAIQQRKELGIRWVCGTGLAEPRFSIAVKKYYDRRRHSAV